MAGKLREERSKFEQRGEECFEDYMVEAGNYPGWEWLAMKAPLAVGRRDVIGLEVYPTKILSDDGRHDEDLPGFISLGGVHRVQGPTLLSCGVSEGVCLFPDLRVTSNDVARGRVGLDLYDINWVFASNVDFPNPTPYVSVDM